MAKLVAFLRGINLGKRTVKMDDLRKAFDAIGFEGAETLIASGNVLFEARESASLAARIEKGLEQAFGFEVRTIVRSVGRLEELVASDPFNGLIQDDGTRLYVYFLAEPESKKLKLPCGVKGDFEVVHTTPGEIFSVAWRKPSGRFGEEMEKAVARPFRAGITNRNWNTILRIVEKARG